jgi:hypothetical protein
LVVVKTNNKKILKKLAINPENQDREVHALQYIGGALMHHHAFNLDDAASLTTCY